ncbi:MAG: 30S ribosomal protein S11 [Candidatus Moranbacteria bacterium]|nr:30S ribosomal protein S11 [Candidatus Moranbacteria bacterium]
MVTTPEKKKEEIKDSADNADAIVEQIAAGGSIVAPTVEKKAQEDVASTKRVKKNRRQISKGQAHVQCTYNNTIVLISDLNGNALAWSSSGKLGFKGAKKSTPFAASQVVKDVVEKIRKYGVSELEVYIKGVGGGREGAIRALAGNGFDLSTIRDLTPIPHNGCRARRPRRV